MSAEQTIVFKHSRKILKDAQGNLLTDSKGNLIIPVPPLQIFTSVDDNHANCSCGCLTLHCNGTTESFRFCKSDAGSFREDQNQFLAKTGDIHNWEVVANLRNILVAAQWASPIKIKCYIGVDDITQKERPVSKMNVAIAWGGERSPVGIITLAHYAKTLFFAAR